MNGGQDRIDSRSKTSTERKTARGRRNRDSEARRDQPVRNGYKNDVSWYSRNPALLVAAGSIPFPYRPGMVLPSALPDLSQLGSQNVTYYPEAIPGVCAIEYLPTVGYSANPTDPASIVGKEMFAKVREAFSGSIDIDPPDFVIYMMCLDSIFSYIAWLKRVYRLVMAYTAENHYLPDVALEAMGFDDDAIKALKANYMQLYQNINELVAMTRKFNIPAKYDIINRHYWLNDNIFMDADSLNSQFYLFTARGFYKYQLSEGDVKFGEAAIWYPNKSGSSVVTNLFAYGRSMINALAGSDDAYIISGYLRRAYDGEPMFVVEGIDLTAPLTPIYEPEVLMQIENCRPLPWMVRSSDSFTISNTISQNPTTNSVLCDPSITLNNVPDNAIQTVIGVTGETALSIRSDTPTVADVVLATRLKMAGRKLEKTATAKQWKYSIVCGSEIVTLIRVLRNYDAIAVSSGAVLKNVQSTILEGTVYFDTRTNPTIAVPEQNGSLLAQAALQSFDWHPILPLILITPASSDPDRTTIYKQYLGDVHNVTTITPEELDNINRVCLYSLFNAYAQ